jgi:hypothetical protein
MLERISKWYILLGFFVSLFKILIEHVTIVDNPLVYRYFTVLYKSGTKKYIQLVFYTHFKIQRDSYHSIYYLVLKTDNLSNILTMRHIILVKF